MRNKNKKENKNKRFTKKNYMGHVLLKEDYN